MAAPETKMHPTKCHHCGVTIQRPPMPAFVDGRVNPEVINYVVSLYGHLEKKHPEEYKAVNAAVQNFMGLTTVANFEITDPALVELHDNIRKHVHQFTTPKTD